jgi:hypothetical protein
MSTTPPEQPTGSTRPMGMPSIPSGARMPIPGNAELAVLAFLQVVLILIWIIADSYTTNDWVFSTVVLTSAYFLSRGIAKASRVLEQ